MSRFHKLLPGLVFAGLIGTLTIGTLTIATWAQADPAQNTDVPAPDPTIGAPGPDCLELYQIDHTEILDDYTILFHMKGDKTYISKLPHRCFGLKFEQGYAYSTSIPKICGKVDFITVIRRGNACPLGTFHEYIKPADDEQKGAKKS